MRYDRYNMQLFVYNGAYLMAIYWMVLIGVAVWFYLGEIRRIQQNERLRPCDRLPQQQPHVSVLIPARNEASRIAGCLDGLVVQSYREFDVIVIDDHSTDGTAALVESYHHRLPALTIMRGEPLPYGWFGKNWACWQASKHAQGEWLLFLDADVVPDPRLLATLVATAEQHDVVSLLPLNLVGSATERLVLPAFFGLLGAIFPLKEVNRKQSPVAFAIGQCLMFRRNVYDAIGGHRAVRASILEDMHLARLTKQRHFDLFVAEAPDLLAVRMYTGWYSVLEGLAKNAAAGARFGGAQGGLIALQRLLMHLLPVQLVLAGLVVGSPMRESLLWMGLLLWAAASIVGGWVIRRYYRMHVAWGMFLPVGLLIYCLIAAYSFVRHWRGRGVWWKGRIIGERG
jgi:chlorobactene glucosyltransferase